MKTSLPIHIESPLVPTGSESACDTLGRYVSDAPVGPVQRVNVRRRTIRLDARRIAAIRAYRENADLA